MHWGGEVPVKLAGASALTRRTTSTGNGTHTSQLGTLRPGVALERNTLGTANQPWALIQRIGTHQRHPDWRVKLIEEDAARLGHTVSVGIAQQRDAVGALNTSTSIFLRYPKH